MDTFIDKLAQKRNAQEMILANMTAEAAKMEQMQNQMKAYDDVQDTLKEYMAKLEAMRTEDAAGEETEQELERLKGLLEERFTQSDDLLHRENVKVYRNVQAAVTEELNKQTEELKKSQEQNRSSRALLPVSIVILIAVLADIAIQLLGITIPF